MSLILGLQKKSNRNTFWKEGAEEGRKCQQALGAEHCKTKRKNPRIEEKRTQSNHGVRERGQCQRGAPIAVFAVVGERQGEIGGKGKFSPH